MATLVAKPTLLSRLYHGIGPSRCLFHATTTVRRSKVTKETDGPICLIGINRPAKKNAVNVQVADELRQRFEEFEQNSEEKVAVLYGHGGTFCAGYDLAQVRNSSISQMQDITMGKHGPMGPTRMLLKKPVIAAIEGYAVAGGLELALMCDLRVSDETAVLGVLCRRYGVPLIDGGTIRLPALIGLSHALDLILTGRTVDAIEAKEMGLINRIARNGTTKQEAIRLAHELAKLPQACMNSDRQSTYNAVFSAGKSMQELLQDEAKFGKSALEELMSDERIGALGQYDKK